MLAAQQKRKENIVEYILYLYQIEDIIRAFKFDIDLIQSQLISNYKTDDATRNEIADWYSNLLIMMDKEQIRNAGHLQFLVNLVNELNQFHLKLMESEMDKNYVSVFKSVAGLLTELKSKNTAAKNQVDLAISTVYGFLLLKMQKKQITNETNEAIKRISNWLSTLSNLFKEYEEGRLELE